MPQAIDTFLDTWTDEFGRAAEMFSGTPLVLAKNSVDSFPDSGEAVLWRKYIFSGAAEFSFYLGAAEQTWQELGNADPDNPQGTYFEIVNQAQSGSATVASRSLEHPISTDDGATIEAEELDLTACFLYELTINTGQVPSLLVAIERAALSVLDEEESAPTPVYDAESSPSGAERLLDLELPVAISLGSARLSIRAVSSMRPGAVVELNKETGEDVELLVHGTVVARGEVTLVKGNYGIRIKHIVGAGDRLSLLRK